jgi:hypothetical protein
MVNEESLINNELKNDLFQKIGRNVLLFQQLEQLLKYIVANSSFKGLVSEISTIKKLNDEKIHKQTMGNLIGQYIENFTPETDTQSTEPEELDEPYISFSFGIECDGDYYQTKKEDLARLVSERNDLIHHFLPRFDPNSVDSCDALCKELDIQSESIKVQIKNLHTEVKLLKDSLNDLSANSTFDSLRGSELVFSLAVVANEFNREDGWTVLSQAGSIVRERARIEFEQMKEVHGYSSLKKLIQATKMFDIYDEVTPKGGSRTLYRLKTGIELVTTLDEVCIKNIPN